MISMAGTNSCCVSQDANASRQVMQAVWTVNAHKYRMHALISSGYLGKSDRAHQFVSAGCAGTGSHGK